jgi:hypothetical protein
LFVLVFVLPWFFFKNCFLLFIMWRVEFPMIYLFISIILLWKVWFMFSSLIFLLFIFVYFIFHCTIITRNKRIALSTLILFNFLCHGVKLFTSFFFLFSFHFFKVGVVHMKLLYMLPF